MKTLFFSHRHRVLLAAFVALPLLACSLSVADPAPAIKQTSQSATPHLPGKFIWAELVTDNVTAVQPFYSALFGWKFSTKGNYLIASNGGRPLAGFIQRPRPSNKPQATPRWFGYLSVTDIERTQKQVTKAGGRVISAPYAIPAGGRKAVFTDREGALFGAIQSEHGDPVDKTAATGGWIWLQLLSRDAQRAANFYSSVGGYQIEKNTAENRSSDYVLSSAGIARATVRTLAPKHAKMQPTWLPFVKVRDVDKSVAKALKLGGKVLVSANPSVMEGNVAVIADPTGAAIGLLESLPE